MAFLIPELCENLLGNDTPSWESTPTELYRTTSRTWQSLSPRSCCSLSEDSLEDEQYTIDLLNEVSLKLQEALGEPEERWPARYSLPSWTQGPRPFYPDNDLETLSSKHSEQRQIWESSEAYHKSRPIFQEVLNRTSPRNIQKCLCLDLGSFSSEQANREVAIARLVAFESWISLIAKHQDRTLPAFFQDPLFTALDRDFLNSRGHIVIEPPASAEVVTEDTFLFAPYCDDGSFCGTLRRAFPVLMLGFDVEERWIEKGPVRRMVQDFASQREWEEIALSALDVDWEKKLGPAVPEDPRTIPPPQDWELVHPLYYRREAVGA